MASSRISNRWFLMIPLIVMLVAWALLQACAPTSCSVAGSVRGSLAMYFWNLPHVTSMTYRQCATYIDGDQSFAF